MSAVTSIQRSVSARASLRYALLGRGAQYWHNVENGTNRAAAFVCSMDNAEEFVQHCEAQAFLHGRKTECFNLVLAADPRVLDVNRQVDVDTMLRLGVNLAEAAYDAEYAIVVHDDARGGHVHAHIYVANHDNSTGRALRRNTSWQRGLHQLSDELLTSAGFTPNPDPFRLKSEWRVRRKDFAEGSFERVLGDRIQAALDDPAVTDRESFERALNAREVKLEETARDGLSYKMDKDVVKRIEGGLMGSSDEDGSKPGRKNWGRRKASRLSLSFTREGVVKVWESRRKVAHQVTTAEIMRRAEARTAESIRRAEESRSRLLEELAVGTDSSLATSPIAHVKAGQPRVADSPVEADELTFRGSRGGGHGGKIREPEPVKPVSTPVPPSPISLTWGDVLADLPWLWEQYLQGHPDYRQEFGLFVSKRVGLVGSLQAVDMAGVFEEFMCEKPQVDEDYSQFVDKRWEVYSSRGGKVERRDVFENQTVRQREEAMQRVKTDIQRQVAGLRHPDVERGMSL